MSKLGQRHRHLTQADRDRIAALDSKGHSSREIGAIIAFDHTAVSREIKRNSNGTDARTAPAKHGAYDPSVAQHKAYVRRKYAAYQGKKIQENKPLHTLIAAKLQDGWNPTEIAGHAKLHKDCHNDHCLHADEGSGCTGGTIYASKTAIYTWLYSEWGQAYCQFLRSKRYRTKPRKPKTTERHMIPNRTSIHDRPDVVASRQEAGHYEFDSVVSSKQSGSTSSLAVLSERSSRLVLA